MSNGRFTIHGVPGSPYVRAALLCLEEKGAAYRLERMPFGAHSQEEHRARNPFGRVPIAEHDGFTLYETQAILRYTDAIFPGPTLQPAGAKPAARMNQIIGIVDSYFFPQGTVGIAAERLASQLFWNRPPDEAKIAASAPGARICVKELGRLKGSAEFMAGDEISIADVMLAPHLELFAATPEGADMLQDSPLRQWLERMTARGSMKATTRERLLEAA
jgi:glutathione S-transferase